MKPLPLNTTALRLCAWSVVHYAAAKHELQNRLQTSCAGRRAPQNRHLSERKR
jgi:hypothetical protein